VSLARRATPAATGGCASSGDRSVELQPAALPAPAPGPAGGPSLPPAPPLPILSSDAPRRGGSSRA